MEFMEYPTFEFGDGRIIPSVRLPRDYLERVPIFYGQGRKEDVVGYVQELKKHLIYCNLINGLNLFDVKSDLVWDDKKGLTTIRMGHSGGLDLDEHGWVSFAEHNLGGIRSIFAGVVATKYVSELWKCEY